MQPQDQIEHEQTAQAREPAATAEDVAVVNSDAAQHAEDGKSSAELADGDVSDDDFEEMVRGALESVGGDLLFKVRVIEAGAAMHAAAAVVGLGDSRQFLLLTLPADGGRLKVETASQSHSPLARIAESYAGLMDVLKVAA